MENEFFTLSRKLRLYLTGLSLLIFTGLTFAQEKQDFVSVTGILERVTAPLDKIDKTSMYGKPLVITRVGAGFADGIPSNKVAERALENRRKYPSDNEEAAEELVKKALEANSRTTLNVPVSTINVNADGQTATNFAPSDNNLAVGPNHVIQIINHSSGSLFKVWDKAGGVVQASVILSTITGLAGKGDPIVLYDQLANRWLLSEFGPSTCCNKLIVAVSATPDPTGSWYIYSYTDVSFFPDYPKYAVWHNAYYATTNDFNTSGSSYIGSSIWAFDRAAMLAGNPTAAVVRTRLNNSNFDFYSMAPVCQEGPTVSNQSGLFSFLDESNDTADPTDVDSIYIFEFTPNFITPANSVIAPKTSMAATVPFNIAAPNATQLGSSTRIDVLNYRLYHKVIYRNYGSSESIVCCSVDGVAAGKTGIHWWELRRPGSGSWSIFQEGVYAPTSELAIHRYLGSIAINANRDIGLIYNVSGVALYPSLRFTGRNECDPPGVMTLPETVIKDGTTFQSGHTRYGDYNTLTIDPSNGSFWGTGQYTAPGFGTFGNWATRIFNFSLTSCAACTPPVVTAPTVTQPTCIDATGTIVVNATGTGTLEYSIDNGTSYQESNTFNALAPGTYNIKVRVKGIADCNTSWAGNPVIFVNPIPTAGVTVNGPPEFCVGGSVGLYAITDYYLKVLVPQELIMPVSTAVFGANVSETPVNGAFVYIPDATASYLGCNPFAAGSLAGKVALIDRGSCLFSTKVKNAQNAGAIAVIMVNNVPGPPVVMGGSDPTVTIPVVMVSQADGLVLKNLISDGLVSGTFYSPNTYLWSNGATTQNISVTQNGVYSVTVTSPAGCQVVSQQVPVTVFQLPNCDITSTPSDPLYTGGVSTNLFLGYGAQSTTLSVSPSGNGPFTYVWTGAGLSNYNTANPVFTPTSEGSFVFTVEVTTANGCKNTCSITICVLDIRERDKKGNLSGKVFICHAPPMTPGNTQTLAVNPNAVPEHLMDHPGDRLGKCTDVICGSNLLFARFSEEKFQEQPEEFSVKVSPNPSSSEFSIQVISKSNMPISVRILDANGVVRSIRSNLVKGSVFRIGRELNNGIYFAEILQGENRRIIKLIKAK